MKEKRVMRNLLLLFAFILLAFKPVTVKAETNATPISVNQNVTGNVYRNGSYIDCYYKAVIPQDGYFTLSFGPKNVGDSSTYWDVRIMDEDGNSYVYWNGYNKITSCKFPAVSGDVILIEVSNDLWASVDYSFRINFTASSEWEKEPNDSQATATKLTAGKAKYGMLTQNDEDWYSFTMPSDRGYVYFTLKPEDISYTGEWYLYVYDKEGNTIRSTYGNNISTVKLPFKPGTKLYVKIYNGYNATWDTYKLTANFVKAGNWEKEWNDSEKTATKLTLGKPCHGILNYYNDSCDFYKFTVKQNSRVTINFGPADISDTGDWSVYLLNSKNDSGEIVRSNAREQVTTYLKKGTYYIKVANYYNAKDREYTVKVSAKKAAISKPTIGKATMGETTNLWLQSRWYLRSLKLKKAAKNVTGYEVSVAKKSNMKGNLYKKYIEGTKKTMSDTTTVDYNGKYYVQVRGEVVDYFGKKWYGPKSNIVKAKKKK